MSVTISAIVCYGILFDEYFVFPWDVEGESYDNDEEDFDRGDIEEWWKKVNGYQNPHKVTRWGADENSKEGKIIDAYFAYERKWEKKNPLPIELITLCSSEEPRYILAVCETTQESYWPDPDVLKMPDNQPDTTALFQFCARFGIKISKKQKPQWYVGTYFSP